MTRSLRIVLPLLSILAALAAPSFAGASNLLANPCFETPCPGAGCGWTFDADGVYYDTNLNSSHSGSAHVVLSANAGHTASASQCVAAGPGKYDASAWYQMDFPAQASLNVTLYSSPGCASGLLTTWGNSGVTAGGWEQILFALTAPPGTQSALFRLFVNAPGAGFDDASLSPVGVTAASIRSFTATRAPAGTLLRWRTASEVEVAGFNLYRLERGRAVKVNGHLIAANARTGASYRLLDRGHRGARYRLEVVNLDGSRQTRTAR